MSIKEKCEFSFNFQRGFCVNVPHLSTVTHGILDQCGHLEACVAVDIHIHLNIAPKGAFFRREISRVTSGAAENE